MPSVHQRISITPNARLIANSKNNYLLGVEWALADGANRMEVELH